MTKIETTACNRRIHPAAAQDDLIDIDSLISDIDETWLFSIDEEHKQKKLDLWNLERSENSRKLLVYKLDSISRQLDGDHSKDLETRNTLNSHQRSPNLLHLSPIPPCSIHCSLWHLIVVLRLSREANRTKKKIRYHREQLYTALCGTL